MKALARLHDLATRMGLTPGRRLQTPWMARFAIAGLAALGLWAALLCGLSRLMGGIFPD